MRIVDQVLIHATLEYHNVSALKDLTLSPFFVMSTMRIITPAAVEPGNAASSIPSAIPSTPPSIQRSSSAMPVVAAATTSAAKPDMRNNRRGGSASIMLLTPPSPWTVQNWTETKLDLRFPSDTSVRQEINRQIAQRKSIATTASAIADAAATAAAAAAANGMNRVSLPFNCLLVAPMQLDRGDDGALHWAQRPEETMVRVSLYHCTAKRESGPKAGDKLAEVDFPLAALLDDPRRDLLFPLTFFDPTANPPRALTTAEAHATARVRLTFMGVCCFPYHCFTRTTISRRSPTA